VDPLTACWRGGQKQFDRFEFVAAPQTRQKLKLPGLTFRLPEKNVLPPRVQVPVSWNAYSVLGFGVGFQYQLAHAFTKRYLFIKRCLRMARFHYSLPDPLTSRSSAFSSRGGLRSLFAVNQRGISGVKIRLHGSPALR
jgi:hypothetical protein